MLDKVPQINKVLEEYFKLNKSVGIIPAKDLMPIFIKAGVFVKDEKGGLPIRKVLRALDEKKQLNLIAFIYPVRKLKNTNWFFKRVEYKPSAALHIEEKKITLGAKKPGSRKDSDEYYVIDLCDKALGQVGLRQYRFPFLLGDANKKGRRASLPIDVYYHDLNLVIEFQEIQHSKSVRHFDKPDVLTVSGVHRGEQRKIYDQRKLEVLPNHGIRLLQIPYSLFTCIRQNSIVRDSINDLLVIKDFLTKHHIL